MLSFLSHYVPVSDGGPVKLRADHDIVVMVCRAQHERSMPFARCKKTSSSDNVTRGDIGEIAVAGVAAGHAHHSRLLRNRSDGYFSNLGAHPVATDAGDVQAFAFHPVFPPSNMEPPIRRATLGTRPRAAASYMFSAKSPWWWWVGLSDAVAI